MGFHNAAAIWGLDILFCFDRRFPKGLYFLDNDLNICRKFFSLTLFYSPSDGSETTRASTNDSNFFHVCFSFHAIPHKFLLEQTTTTTQHRDFIIHRDHNFYLFDENGGKKMWMQWDSDVSHL